MASALTIFSENLKLFGNTNGTAEEKEKYNLYSGLMVLGRDIQEIDHKLKKIESLLQNIQATVNSR